MSINIRLNPDGIVAPLNALLKESTNAVMFGLQAVEEFKTPPPSWDPEQGAMPFMFGEMPSFDGSKEDFKRWLIRKGVEDLIKAIKASMEEAFVYVKIIKLVGKSMKEIELQTYLKDLKQEAHGMELPNLLNRLQDEDVIIKYSKEILSFNRIRRCLVHNNGVVSEKYLSNPQKKILLLEWYALELFAEKDGESKPVKIGGVVEGGWQMMMKTIEKQKEFKLGGRVILNYAEFNGLVYTCWIFAHELAAAMPKINPEPVQSSGAGVG